MKFFLDTADVDEIREWNATGLLDGVTTNSGITSFNFEDPFLFSSIGINCHLCPRQACSQGVHQPPFLELPISTNRRGNTRYEN